MATSTIRKAIGAVKDQTSISIAKVAGNVAPDLEVLIVKATSHDNEPSEDRHIREIINLTSYSKGYVNACVVTISKRLSKTHDWIVAVKALVLVHKLLVEGDPILGQEIMYASRKGTRVLNMSDFRDEAHSSSWDHSGFVKAYALYLDQKLEFMAFERKLSSVDDRRRYEDGSGNFRDSQRSGSYAYLYESGGRGDMNDAKGTTPVREMKPERVLERLNHLLRLLDRFLACRPSGNAKNSRMILVALYIVVKESFKLYADICEGLGILHDRFQEMEYADCVKGLDAYVAAAKMIDELVGFYNWCKDIGLTRSSEFPEVQKITDNLLGTLEVSMRERTNRPKSLEKRTEDSSSANNEEESPNMNEIKALPPPENYTPPPPPPAPPAPQPKPQIHQVTNDLVNLKDDAVSAESQGNQLALALFSGPPIVNANGSWEVFSSSGEPEVTSAWQTPAAESGKADWELALVESASNLSKQKADMGGGLDPLLLNGMYDQGAVRQHVSNSQLSGGSASSVALPGMGKNATPILALPAPDGTVQTVGPQDPFAASLAVPPPSYVQIAEMERKQQLLSQEQQLWQQYGSTGMQGQVALAKLGAGVAHSGMGQPAGYYYPHF